MTTIRRERPKCRQALIALCKEYNCSLEALLRDKYEILSTGLQIQARRMIAEKEVKNDSNHA